MEKFKPEEENEIYQHQNKVNKNNKNNFFALMLKSFEFFENLIEPFSKCFCLFNEINDFFKLNEATSIIIFFFAEKLFRIY
jgi:hypothetical protein